MALTLVKKFLYLAIIFLSCLSIGSSHYALAEGGAPKEGLVVHTNDQDDFIFVNLGEDDARIGDSIEIYRNSEQIATGSIQTVLEEVSEVLVVEKDVPVKIGDNIVSRKLTEKVLPETKKPFLYKEKTGEKKISAPVLIRKESIRVKPVLKKASDTTDTTSVFRERIASLEEEKEEMESLLRSEILSLRETERSLRTELSALKKSTEEKTTKLEGEMVTLFKTKKDNVGKLETRLQELTKDRSKTEATLKEEIRSLKEREKTLEGRLEYLEESKKHGEESYQKEIK